MEPSKNNVFSITSGVVLCVRLILTFKEFTPEKGLIVNPVLYKAVVATQFHGTTATVVLHIPRDFCTIIILLLV